ncbi:hypothetical protein SynBIOSU31_01269 [Synechococcus sp. BIOS-U3-1]|uniref:DUF6998 domain-containing protein n=1 Tax=Synechococcus sp. BIOS-U3-1 TaxID=1400865 RepID=UPI001648D409|nr:hypothetical protein [Synechococcus sp. BIOS-U3-1]QNI58148.1 hypothetical protein SynBIOSU31_01269 [Synechococcus sp. BIOS-U3-1]
MHLDTLDLLIIVDTVKLQSLIPELYAVVDKLEAAAPGRKFTPAGPMVGNIGEVVAAIRFDLKLNPASTEGFDATAPDGTKVEVKTTQQERGYFALKSTCWKDVHLLALKINPADGGVRVVFNGPYDLIWENCGPMQKWNGRTITVAKCKKLQKLVPADHRLKEVGGC